MKDQHLLSYLENFISQARKDRFLEVLEERTKFITVAIEDVFQVHNSSAVIRSCEVFGVQEIHVIENRYGNRMDNKIAMGAQQWVDTYRYKNASECIDDLRKSGYQIVATTPNHTACSLEKFEITDKLALFFGTEKEGLSNVVLERADTFLKIPMYGFTESLNISVSVAIILHQLTSKLKKSKLSWGLTDDEKLAIRLKWTKQSIRSIDDVLARYHGIK
ncbi:MAG: RNA methyltransferase [Maribacter sp.]|nr:RNA methyltransferase [Maribacter sp.]